MKTGALLVALILAGSILAGTAWAADVQVGQFTTRIWGVQGYGVWLVVKDFWDREAGRRLIRTPASEIELRWVPRCNGPCRVEIERELTEAEFKEAERQQQLDRIEGIMNCYRSGACR